LAQVQQAEIQLGYTQILAPIAGRTGEFSVHPGDLVVANSATPLLVINQSDPVWINFHLNQSQLHAVLRYQKENRLTVNVWGDEADQEKPLGVGELVLIDNSINPQTGTVLLKAKIPNTDGLLWPGMMVNAELVLRVEPDAVVIPAKAIQFDQSGSFVYGVEKEKAIIKRVVVSRQIKEWAVIQSGLMGKETVILSISPDLHEGSAIQVEKPQ
jgi:multidrug efflux system membrane fusion protein